VALLRRLGLEPDVRYRPRGPDDSRYRRCADELTLYQLREHFGYADKKAGGERVDAHLPTLEDFMQLASKQSELCIVFLDIKLPSDRAELLRSLLTRLDRLVADLRPTFEIVLETVHPPMVRELAELAPHYSTTLDVEPPAGIVLNPEKCSAARAALANGANWAPPQKPRFTTFRGFDVHLEVAKHDVHLLAQARPGAHGGVCSFTINEARQMEQLIEAGVTAIQSDRPALLRQVAERCGCSMSRVAGDRFEP
jgi:glycerophosphoryl diester phosphodiesterase